MFGSRNLAAANPHQTLATFSASSSTSTLRNHLIHRHGTLWVQGCDRLKIPIKTDAGLAAAERVRGTLPGEHPRSKTPARPFSNAAFVDAIVEFIVGDDLVVSAIRLCYLVLITIMYSH